MEVWILLGQPAFLGGREDLQTYSYSEPVSDKPELATLIRGTIGKSQEPVWWLFCRIFDFGAIYSLFGKILLCKSCVVFNYDFI